MTTTSPWVWPDQKTMVWLNAVLVLWGLGLVGGGGEVSSWLTNGSFLFAEKTRITITTEGSQYVILEPSLFSVLGERQSLRFNIVRDIPPDFHSTCSHWQRMYLTRVGRVCVKVSSCKVDCWSMTMALQSRASRSSPLPFKFPPFVEPQKKSDCRLVGIMNRLFEINLDSICPVYLKLS